MGKISNPDISEALHIELRGAFHDLAKSVKVAATRIQLKAECTAAIKDAAKAENIAKALRATARASADEPEAPLAPGAHSSFIDNANGRDAIETIYDACTWLRNSQTFRSKPKAEAAAQEENAIALRIVELQDRLRDQGKDAD